jgi:hypothetical protein
MRRQSETRSFAKAKRLLKSEMWDSTSGATSAIGCTSDVVFDSI